MEDGLHISGYKISSPVEITAWNLVDTGDFDADGIDDVLWQSAESLVHAWNIGDEPTALR